eukprot:m.179954 g.179954  ORF g.179954 m.179954 type:complete len:307 (+) comp18401_c1_seq6:224-1144(+)
MHSLGLKYSMLTSPSRVLATVFILTGASNSVVSLGQNNLHPTDTHQTETTHDIPDPVMAVHGGYPRAIQSRDNSVVYLCTGGQSLQVSNATWNDETKSWGPWTAIGIVVKDERLGVDLANCVLHELQNGTLLAAYRHHTGCASETDVCTRYALEVSVSYDKGISWHPLSTVVAGSVGMWEPFFFETHGAAVEANASTASGTLREGVEALSQNATSIWIAYSQELTNGGLQSIVWQKTTDRGLSWHAPETISDGKEHSSRDGGYAFTSCKPGSHERSPVLPSVHVQNFPTLLVDSSVELYYCHPLYD